MKKTSEYYEMLAELGLGEPLTDEEIKKYQECAQKEVGYPNVVYNPKDSSYTKVSDKDLSFEDFVKLMMIKQYKTTVTIKKYALFFVVLAVIGIAASLLVALSSLGG